MPKVKLPPTPLIREALNSYSAELNALVNQIRQQAHRASTDAELYIPASLKDEVEWCAWADGTITQLERDVSFRMFGGMVQPQALRVLHSALVFHLEPLRRESLTNQPLARQVAEIEHHVEFWRQFGESPVLPLLIASRRKRLAPPSWRRTLDWVLRPDGRPDESSRVWCICDTNFFIESRATFEQVAWNSVWGFESVVLVVPQAMLRELDEFKSDPRRERLRARARAVLPLLTRFSDAAEPGVPAEVRRGADLLLLDGEPQHYPDGLDPSLPDDRLIAAALECKQALPNEHVVVVSEDIGPRQKARRWGLTCVTLPDAERRPAD